MWKAQNRALSSYRLCDTLVKQLYSLTLLCSRTTLPKILFDVLFYVLLYHKFSWFYPYVLGRVKLVTSIASLLGVGHYKRFMKNCTSQLVLSTFLLVHLHRMCGLSVGIHHDFFRFKILRF
ncbi:hypothetical protein CR513_50286, partial [Mucuna pruriens]